MNGIEPVAAALAASRLDSLLTTGPTGAAGATQAGASALAAGTAAQPGAVPAPPPPPPASAQTALSAVALTLDAIVRSGGDATPAVIGTAPIWPAAPALDVHTIQTAGTADSAAWSAFVAGSAVADLLDGTGAGAAGSAVSTASTAAQAGGAAAAGTAGTTASASGASAQATGTASAIVAPVQVPVTALAAALAQTVSESGLFYEAHLAQWLAGMRTPAQLAGEPQNQLVAAAAAMPSDWTGAPDDLDAPWTGPGSAVAFGQRFAASSDANAASAGAGRPFGAPPQAAGAVGPFHGEPGAYAAAFTPPSAQTLRALLHGGGASQTQASASADSAQANAAAVHPATIPVVRQQLDLLATGQFRWTGEAWPGVRLDWTIEEEGGERSRGAGMEAGELPWRTRVTLSLPTLGTVDAELTLTGDGLVARVQASPGGASRLAAQSETFRRALAAAGIALQGLSIREIGGSTLAEDAEPLAAGLGPQPFQPDQARQPRPAAEAASAYARTAADAQIQIPGAVPADAADSADEAGARADAAHPASPVTEGPLPVASRTTHLDFDWDI